MKDYFFKTFDFSDKSRLSLPVTAFQPKGREMGCFDRQGVVPDVIVPSRWDLFTEATDPLLARAVNLLYLYLMPGRANVDSEMVFKS